MSTQCRTCAAKIFNPNAKNLFEEDDNEILLNIEILTGIRIKEDHHMPKHICTCCHLDLYYSIEFRERCLRSEKILQRAKQNVALLDPLVETSIRKPEPQLEAAKSLSKGHVIDNSINKILSQHSTQRRSPRTRTQIATSPREKLLYNKKTHPNVSIPDETSSVSKLDTDPRATEHLKCSPRSTRGSCEESQSTSAEELDNFRAQDVISAFVETEFEKSLTSPSQMDTSAKAIADAIPKAIEEPLPKQYDKFTNDTFTKKGKRIVKPAANPRVFICDLCGHQSSSPKNLDIHILRHKGEKNFECVECGTRHYSKYLLQLHVRVKHQGEMPFVCRYCGQRFYSASERGRHEKVRHVRDFNYECKVCGKKYLTKSCLNKHEFLHTGLRPYRCDLCNVAFPRKPGLKIHCRTKQHQKRASEALNSQLNVINDISVADGSIVFPDSIIEELVDA